MKGPARKRLCPLLQNANILDEIAFQSENHY